MQEINCLICGHIEKEVEIEKANGWFVCPKCHNEYGITKYMKWVKIPLIKSNTAEGKLQ